MEQEQNRDTTKPDARSAQDLSAAKQQDDADETLVDAALACVRWDESVDLERLMALEFEYNLGLLVSWLAGLSPIARRYVQKLECMTRRPSCESVDLIPHDGGTWSLDNGERMTDAQLAGLLAVCARHINFWLTLSATEAVRYAQTWLSRVVDGLARQQRAWAGIEIMRTRNLCVALAALVDTRERSVLFARVDMPKSGPFDQGAVPPDRAGDDVATCPAAMREAMARAHGLLQTRLVFRRHCVLWSHPNRTEAFEFTRRLLAVVQSTVERLYATEAVYIQMIAPAEYETMAVESPLGAALLH
ncbi:hypothetical protein [Pandoravirus japonicus]|uniref:Uncharacterized protein n=1 Tax=Pandoravirus japonicus TaxID=2823154 RepID=A0A811BNQ7_9VIRU|nr:hypothetical protein [Pandoravirus japonicus]